MFTQFSPVAVCGKKRIIRGLLLAAAWLAAGPAVLAERPSTMKLFPEETFVFVRTPNAYEMIERFKETATGRLARDPQLKPLVDQLYGRVGDLYAEKAQDKLGVSWDELQQLPHGEVAFGVVGRPVGEPAILLLVDQGDAPNVARRLLDKVLEGQVDKGGVTSTEQIRGVKVTVVRRGEDQKKMLGLFEKDNTVVLSSEAEVLQEVLAHWEPDAEPTSTDAGAADDDDGTASPSFYSGRTLAENANFAVIFRQCRREQDPAPN